MKSRNENLVSHSLAGNILGQNTEQGDYIYDYDRIDQLTNVNVSAYSGPSGIATNEAFVYDLMGNRTGFTQGTNITSYTANSLNQYSEIENPQSQIENYQYDLNGNQLVHYQELSDGTVITNCLAWDIENRLISITNQQGDLANYSYDPFGHRLSKVVNGVTNYFMYADEGLIAEYDGEGNLTREYGYTPGSMWMNNLVFMKTLGQGSTNYYYAINDHLGAVQKLIANNGSVVWSMAQDAFGRDVVSSNSDIICNLRFSSQYYDSESGLHYNTMRYYDPISGKYLSKDSIVEFREINLYGFCLNGPIQNIDIMGFYTLYFPLMWSETRERQVLITFAKLRGQVSQLLNSLDAVTAQISTWPSACSYKRDMLHQLNYAKATMRSVQAGLASSGRLNISGWVLPGDLATYWMYWPAGLPFTGGPMIGLRDNSDSQSILHELTHMYGSSDYKLNNSLFDSLYNPEYLASMLGINYNNTVQSVLNALEEKYGRSKCCPTYIRGP